jgi:hypothetical protein
MPSLVNGCGTAFVGRHDPALDGTFVLTEWIIVAFLPIFPLRSVRVLAESSPTGFPFVYLSRQYKCVETKLDWPHIRRIYAGVIPIIIIILGVMFYGMHAASSKHG